MKQVDDEPSRRCSPDRRAYGRDPQRAEDTRSAGRRSDDAPLPRGAGNLDSWEPASVASVPGFQTPTPPPAPPATSARDGFDGANNFAVEYDVRGHAAVP